ncbi:MAG: radical SAM family heme chaperone HemW [Firmicutes bacterium]|nr:radical SAM family heme chaperone HemW [Bacillota bacterium]
MKPKPLSLYLHIPFCTKKCDYCDFVSFDDKCSQIDSYIDALCNEIKSYRERCTGHVVGTIFVGGGTPSLLDTKQIDRLFRAIRDAFVIEDDAEITIECNPSSITAAKLTTYKRVGINRISLGIQSYDTFELKTLGRAQTTESVFRALARINDAGFDNVSIDLIYNIPLPREVALSGMRRNISYEVGYIFHKAPFIKHVSAYALIPEDDTPMMERLDYEELLELDEDSAINEELDLYNAIHAQGLRRYEVSNWARPGYESRHNKMYWAADAEYLGLGLNASGLFNDERYTNTDDLGMYLLNPNKVIKQEVRPRDRVVNEIIMLGLRTKYGIDLRKLERYGVDLVREKTKEIMQLREHKLLTITKNKIKATTDGMYILNMLIEMLTFDKEAFESNGAEE